MRRGARSAIALGISAVVIGGGIWGVQRYIHESQALVVVQCATTVGGVKHTLDPEQTGNAATIAAVAVGRDLPARATTIALATAFQESKLRNLDYGDTAGPDSRGLFQQRPSQGWGTQEEVMTPVYAAGAFFDELITFDYRSMSVTAAAQKVQRSAYPLAYADHEAMGRAFASALTGESASALNCSLRRTTQAGSASAVAERMKLEYSERLFSPRISDDIVTVKVSNATHGWSLAQWAVAHARDESIVSVSYAGLTWNRSQGGWVQGESATAAPGSGAGTVAIQVASGPDQG